MPENVCPLLPNTSATDVIKQLWAHSPEDNSYLQEWKADQDRWWGVPWAPGTAGGEAACNPYLHPQQEAEDKILSGKEITQQKA